MRIRFTVLLAILPVLGAAALGPDEADKVVSAAYSHLGTPYLYGGTTASGMDCSGLVCASFQEAGGPDLPRTVDGLFAFAKTAPAPLHIGDLLFFDTSSPVPIDASKAVPSHVGIFIGGGRFIHSASEGPQTGVIVSTLDEKYYADRFIGARRPILWRPREIELALDGTPGSESTYASRTTLEVKVTGSDSDGGPVIMRASRDGEEVLLRRLMPSKAAPSVLSLVPDAGRWTLVVSGLSGNVLASASFEVQE